MCICSQGGNKQSLGERSEHPSPTARSEGQKSPPAAHRNPPSNSRKRVSACDSSVRNEINKPASSSYARNTDRGKPIRCIPGRECRGG
ncbi:hypothetical protein SLEP1_g6866 [Rubroshorea leprosula]|uniref:Uncharacterized protein n=1 Tax=Rubroshorea leprosula TaxID=152421 RepID=A0AAV5I2K6_9ROSI|nr:hypothetical protein SLEP1_g6866 [Rubroshorea leprosula]